MYETYSLTLSIAQLPTGRRHRPSVGQDMVVRQFLKTPKADRAGLIPLYPLLRQSSMYFSITSGLYSAPYPQASSYILKSASFLLMMSAANTQLLSLLQSMSPPLHFSTLLTAFSQFVATSLNELSFENSRLISTFVFSDPSAMYFLNVDNARSFIVKAVNRCALSKCSVSLCFISTAS